MKAQKLNNVDTALRFLAEEEKIKLVNICEWLVQLNFPIILIILIMITTILIKFNFYHINTTITQ